MSTNFTAQLIGGPPWGFRISQDDELRPIVGQILPGGRGDVSGLRIGDRIQQIENQQVSTCQQANLLLHSIEGKLKIHIERNPQNFHSTVRREKLSNSVTTSPIMSQKTGPTFSVPSSPCLPRTNPYHSRNTPRQVRMDLMNESKSDVDKKRQIFEQNLNETDCISMVDELLKRKIQMGVQHQGPSSSSTGYDSVAADFAGSSSSHQSSPSLSTSTNSRDEPTIVENPKTEETMNGNGFVQENLQPINEKLYQNDQQLHSSDFFNQNQITPSDLTNTPSSSNHQWPIQTEQSRNNMPAQGDIEVPVRRNVAALRQVINDRLEMKTPVGGVSATRPKTPQEPNFNQNQNVPSWTKNVKVYEPNGFLDPHSDKHNMGRVLDGPVNPNKYFQGVPPPSHNQVTIEAKPPAPRPKPQQQTSRTSSTIRLPPELSQNNYLQQFNPPKQFYRHPQFVDLNQNDDVDDNASMISSCISTFGDSSEIAAFSALGAQRQLYDQYRRGLLNTNQSNGGEMTPSPMPTTIPEEMSSSINEKSESTTIVEKLPSSASIFNSDIQLTPFGQTNIEKNEQKTENSRGPSLTRSGSKQSIDLESSELLIKSKSPAPYSSSTADHYGTIRRRHTPVRLETDQESLSIGPHVEHRSSDSGYEGSGSNAISPEQNNLNKALSDAFELASSLASSINLMEGSESRPDSFLVSNSIPNLSQIKNEKKSTQEQCATSPSAAASSSSPPHQTPPILPTSSTTTQQHQFGVEPNSLPSIGEINNVSRRESSNQSIADPEDLMYPKRHFHSATEPELSLWYRKMFKQMHKPATEIEAGSIYTSQQSPAPQPSTTASQQPNFRQNNTNFQNSKESELIQDQIAHISRPPTKVEIEIEPRRAKSVGRVVEPSKDVENNRKGVSSNSHLYALERSKTPHFHLPSYKFRDEDSRPIRCTFGGCLNRPSTLLPTQIDDVKTFEAETFGTRCMICGNRRKDDNFAQVDQIYAEMEKRRHREARRAQKKIELYNMTEKLDETTKELDVFIDRLEKSWQRSKSQPIIRLTTNHIIKEKSSKSLAEEIEELKRISREEQFVRQKAEKLTDELQKEKDRRHTYLPSSAAPSLHNNMNRFEGLLKDYSRTEQSIPNRGYESHSNHSNPIILTATVIYNFDSRNSRELPLNKGDVVRIIREVDSHWLEGERNGRSGIFPASYVQIESEFEKSRQKMRTIYPFTARNGNELSLKKGEIVTFRREIDLNWLEGSNQIGQIGIFPSSYVRMLSDPPPTDPVGAQTTIIPDRPKTPKIISQYQNPTESHLPQQRVRFEEPIEYNQYQSINNYQSTIGGTSANFDIDFGEQKCANSNPQTNFNIPIQQQNKSIDRTGGEWESKKLASEPIRQQSQNWEMQEKILDQIRRPTSTQKVAEIRRPIQSESQLIPSNSDNQNVKDIRQNAASLIPKGSEMFRAIYAYKPEKEDELELFVDDIVFVVEKCDDGWFIGTSLRTGDFGIFPGNYVQKH